MEDERLMTLEQLCEVRGVNFQDVEDLLELYCSEAPEEDVLARIAQYPIKARELVSSVILPPMETNHP